jgi:CelD/BcsL family acetyltransferase involved in cellulose biosynthesis
MAVATLCGFPLCSAVRNLRTITVRDFDTLARHFAAWDQLAREAPGSVPTQAPAWVDAFLRHRLRANEEWLCSFAYDDDRLVGALPIIVAREGILGRRWPVLRTPYDEHMPSGDILLAPDSAARVLKALLAEVAGQIPGHLGLNLHGVRHGSPLRCAIPKGSRDYIVLRGPRSLYAFLNVQGDSQPYWAELTKMRKNLRRAFSKLEKRGAISVEMSRGSSAGVGFLPQFLALEASGWKGREGTAILCDPNLVTFYTTLVGNLASRGQLEWHTLRVAGQLVAAQLGIRCGGSLVLWKYAYDENFSECSPGHALTAEVFRDAFSDLEIVEVSPMSDAHQSRLWHMPMREYINLHLVRWSILGILIHLPRLATMLACQYGCSRIPSILKWACRTSEREPERTKSYAH